MKKEIIDAIVALSDVNGGTLTPELVVKSAENKNSPLHECFTWDNKAAGTAYRLIEARTLIRSVRVEISTEQFSVKAPMFVRDPSLPADEQGYASIGRLRSDEDMAREAVVAEFSRAGAALARAKAVAAALSLSDEIEEIRAKVERFGQSVAMRAS